MAEKRRVLVVDNDEDMRDMLAFRLDIAGYRVFTADSMAAALDLLEREVVHLAVLDVRLDDDSRPGDHSGFELGTRLPPYIPYIAFTAYEDVGNLRLANRLGSRIQSKATDDAIPQLLDLIDDTFRTRAQVNVDLAIRLPDGGSCDDLARQIEVSGPPDAPQPGGDDLVRILQTLFFEAAEVEVAPLLPPEKAPTFSQSGSLLVLARTSYPGLGRAEPVVVKLSSAEEARREAESYPQIEPFLHGSRAASLRRVAYSRRLGGLLYSLIDDEDLDTIGNFEQVYHRYDAPRLVALLERFFGQMLGPLFKSARREQVDLAELYAEALRLTPAKLDAALLHLRPEAAARELRLPGLAEPLLNPAAWLREGDGFRRFPATAPVCLCHGDLHGRNILVDSADRFWLIDFACVGQSHALRDFAELEVDIKFNLLRENDLGALLPFERRLLAPARFGEPLPAGEHANPLLRKAHAVLDALRRIAAEQLRLDGDIREYYLALLFHTLKVLRLSSIPDPRKQHALLAAALICRRLDAWPGSGE
jgi:CheY-like chemotaxis protein